MKGQGANGGRWFDRRSESTQASIMVGTDYTDSAGIFTERTIGGVIPADEMINSPASHRRHGGRRPAIHVFSDSDNARRGWPAFAGHDGAARRGLIIWTVGIMREAPLTSFRGDPCLFPAQSVPKTMLAALPADGMNANSSHIQMHCIAHQRTAAATSASLRRSTSTSAAFRPSAIAAGSVPASLTSALSVFCSSTLIGLGR